MAKSALFCDSVNCRRTFFGIISLSCWISSDSDMCLLERVSSSLAAMVKKRKKICIILE
jgi:hypothetical protein